MSPDEQEALSRKYSDQVIILLPLKNGKIAVFNAARELCAITKGSGWDELTFEYFYDALWHPPATEPFSGFTLEDLNLL